MKKLCHFIATMCILAMPFSAVAKKSGPRFKIKPSLGISLNKRSISANVKNYYYLNSLSNAGSTLVNNFVTKPFGEVVTTFPTYKTADFGNDAYLGPGYAYIDEDFVLKKTGAALANATSDDAIAGNKIKLALVSNANVGYMGLNAADGQTLVSISLFDEVSPATAMVLTDLSGFSGEVTHSVLKAGGTHDVSYIIRNSNKLLKVVPGSGDFSSGLNKYYDLLASEKYYFVLGNNTTPANNFDLLISDSFTDAPDLSTYTQKDYEYIDYLGVTLGVDIEVPISSTLFFNIKGDLTTPVEKIEHTAKFIAIKPEADLSLKAGLSYGNENGSVGFLYGAVYDRLVAHMKRFTVSSISGAPPVLKSTLTELKEFTTCVELTANIHLAPQVNAYMSTSVTSDDYKIDLAGLENRADATNQRFLIGVSINYQD